ncbi:RHS repeat-associated core domain-containing protein [Dysgonomonas sp. BGC7]|uniref:RHS repeat-associated core domain-containing protein n=1 Tax=Dysgonomonas sp. BGC7 TaxID=1658008 RepID=UPI000681199A|nr:RHS repeat-associated core domain-containing protein [Dysgonomonas sp. BGC7]
MNLYDYSARYYEPAIRRFTTVDPLAEKFYFISPYAYCNNNPIKFIDPTGMSYGDFINEKGKIIGNDGINDGKLYVIKTTEKHFDSGGASAGISSKDKKETEKFIKDNSGNTAAFQSNSIAYDNSVEIEGSATVRQDMVTEISKDNGKGGTSNANNREYGGNIINGQAVAATPGPVSNPAVNNIAFIILSTGSPSYHSHPSGSVSTTTSNTSFNGTASSIGGTTTITHSFNQAPCQPDINNTGSYTNYVFGRSTGKTYIHNYQGVQAILPTKKFVNPSR